MRRILYNYIISKSKSNSILKKVQFSPGAITGILSLYFTATQNHWCWVLALAQTPNTTLLHHLTQNIPTCWYILALPNAKICVTPDAKPKICVTPDANPRHQSVEYRWRWAFWRWACTFQVVCVNFICVW